VSRRRFGLQGLRARHLILAALLGAASIFHIVTTSAETVMFDVARAELAYDQRSGEPIVSFRFTPDSARKFAEFTLRNVGHVAEIRVDGKIYSRPVIREPILQGVGQISGQSSVQEARDLAARLSAGTKLEIEAVAN
jgi:preprotein translocase subunit SecD